MKKVILFIMAFAVCAIYSSCYAKKPKKDNTKTETYAMPCQDVVKADDKYYMAFGVSHPQRDIHVATMEALSNAQHKLQLQMAGHDVTNSENGVTISQGQINNFEIICEKYAIDEAGYHTAYIAIRTTKGTDNADSPLE